MNNYDVVIRFTTLQPKEQYMRVSILAPDPACAEKRAKREFWKHYDNEPQPVVEIDHVTVTPNAKEIGNGI